MFGQAVDVERRTAFGELIVEVECSHHGESHAAHLEGEEEIALQIVYIKHIEHHAMSPLRSSLIT